MSRKLFFRSLSGDVQLMKIQSRLEFDSLNFFELPIPYRNLLSQISNLEKCLDDCFHYLNSLSDDQSKEASDYSE